MGCLILVVFVNSFLASDCNLPLLIFFANSLDADQPHKMSVSDLDSNYLTF